MAFVIADNFGLHGLSPNNEMSRGRGDFGCEVLIDSRLLILMLGIGLDHHIVNADVLAYFSERFNFMLVFRQ